jgi:hydroxymethylpyrimidine/phosphomethylpyrimidine kinase
MLGSTSAVASVAKVLRALRDVPIVLDPVMISTSGSHLLSPRARSGLRKELIPLVDVLTPNIPEAAALLGRALSAREDLGSATQDLLALGARSILLKGGHHNTDPVCDYFIDENGARMFRHNRRPISAHGTGCILSAAIAALLALGHTRVEAVERAERYLQKALKNAYRAGKGSVLVLPPVQVARR